MIIKKYSILLIFTLSSLCLLSCTNQNSDEIKNDNNVTIKEEIDIKFPKEEIDTDIARKVQYYEKSMLIDDLNLYSKFGEKNQCKVILNEENNLSFFILKITGTETGAPSGPLVEFVVDLTNYEILEKSFTPSPDYQAIGQLEFSEYSNEIITLNDNEIIEIAKYFENFISNIEKK